MGLDDLMRQQDVEKERILAGKWSSKIKPDVAWEIASNAVRMPVNKFELQVIEGELSASSELRLSAAETVKLLIRVAQKVYHTRDERQIAAYRRSIQRDESISSEEQELCVLAVDLFSQHPDYERLVNYLKSTHVGKLFSRSNDDEQDIEKIIQSFKKKRHALGRSEEQYALKGVMCWLGKHVRGTGFDAQFERMSTLLNEVSRNISFGFSSHAGFMHILSQKSEKQSVVEYDIGEPKTESIVARLNSSPELLMSNNVSCCITGPHGRHREASLLYWLDPACHVWELYAVSASEDMRTVSDSSRPFGLGLFVKAKGAHHLAQKSTNYLIFEGFPANGVDYVRASVLVHLNSSGPYDTQMPPELQYPSLAKLVYTLGLITAREEGCEKLLINTSHSAHTQVSVQDSLNEIIKVAQKSSCWDAAQKKLMRDPSSFDGTFGTFYVPAGKKDGHKVNARTFEYTHFLQKEPFPLEILEKIQYVEKNGVTHWHGEHVLDTFYPWTCFAGNTYDRWRDEEKAAHSYAQQIAVRAKIAHSQGLNPESFWNQGIGYCTGIEVDVESECKRLGIKSRENIYTA